MAKKSRLSAAHGAGVPASAAARTAAAAPATGPARPAAAAPAVAVAAAANVLAASAALAASRRYAPRAIDANVVALATNIAAPTFGPGASNVANRENPGIANHVTP